MLPEYSVPCVSCLENGASRTGTMPCTSEEMIDPGLDGRANGVGDVDTYGLEGLKNDDAVWIPVVEVGLFTVRGCSNGRGGGGENRSPETSGFVFWVREREETIDPDLV